MKKTLVIYWSGTGNTEAMANAVVDGMKEAGADGACCDGPTHVKADAVAEFDAVAMGCPAMGAEVLEETEFDPMYQSVKASSVRQGRGPVRLLRLGRRRMDARSGKTTCKAAGVQARP